MATKVYISGVFIREHIFPSGDSQLQISIPQDKLGAVFDQLDAACKTGWCKLVINKNRQPTLTKAGKILATHSLAVDNYEPKQGQAQPATPAPIRAKHDDNTGSSDTSEPVQDDVPF